MQFTLNSFHVMSHYFCNKQSIDTFFMSYAFNNIFVDTIFFFNFSTLTAIEEYIFDFNHINSLIIFALNSPFILPITFLLTGSKKTLNLVDNH